MMGHGLNVYRDKHLLATHIISVLVLPCKHEPRGLNEILSTSSIVGFQELASDPHDSSLET